MRPNAFRAQGSAPTGPMSVLLFHDPGNAQIALGDGRLCRRVLTNQDAAKRAVTAIRQSVKVLSLQPGMGRPV